MIHVADLADGGHAAGGHVAQLSGGEADQGVFALFGHQLGGVAGGAHQLGALAGVELDVVDDGAVGDVLQGQSIARLDVGVGAGDHLVADFQADRGQDVALVAVDELDEGDVGGAVGIVLQGLDGPLHAEVVALKVDDAVLSSLLPAAVADGDAAVAVAARMVFSGGPAGSSPALLWTARNNR